MKYSADSSDASFIYSDSSASNLKQVDDSAEKANLSDVMKNTFFVTKITFHDDVDTP